MADVLELLEPPALVNPATGEPFDPADLELTIARGPLVYVDPDTGEEFEHPGQGAESAYTLDRWAEQLLAGPLTATWDGAALVAAMRRFEGQRYSTASGRDDPATDFADCSGSICKGWRVLGVWPGGTVSTTMERWAISRGGRYITREEALWTPGAGLTVGGRSHGWNGLGANGHIAVSVGNGRDHYGTPRGSYGRSVGQAPFSMFQWGDYFTWGGGAPAPEPPKPPPLDSEVNDMSDTLQLFFPNNDTRQEWQRLNVDESGTLWHEWYDRNVAGGVNRVALAGPHETVPASRRGPKVTKVTVQKGVAGNGFRVDAVAELEGEGRGVFHFWRGHNGTPWVFIDERT